MRSAGGALSRAAGEVMTESTHSAAPSGPAHRSVEIGVALATFAFGAIVIYGGIQVGINWGIEGPRAGFFPFYVGLLIVIASAINLFQIMAGGRSGKLFAEWGHLRQVLYVVIPSAIYVALVPSLGIYASSMLLIGVFMKWLGRYGWGLTLAIAIAVPLIFFVIFERWFLIPLPKGPIEDWLHL
jgi:hypothetical protein